MNRLLIFAFLGGGIGVAPAAEPAPPLDEIHACPDAKGNVVYQDDPCVVPAPLPPPAKPVTQPKPQPKAKPPPKAKPQPKAQAKAEVKPPPKVAPAAFVPPKSIKAIVDPRTFTSDPKWGSPERTLRTFVAAMKGGDRTLVRSCLTATALTDFGARVDSIPAETLRATVDAYTGFVLEGDLGPFWSIRALRAGARPKWIFFERTADGTWKISAI